jgi:uncharacterized protein
MDITSLDRPLLYRGQYTDKIGDYRLYYNPCGYGGVTLVDVQTQQLLELCDGVRTVDQIARLDSRTPSVVLEEIQALATREVVSIADQFTKDLHLGLRRKGSIACWLHLTNNCNLACSYCFVHKSAGNMSLATGQRTIDKMIQSCRQHRFGNISIKFSGGEPLLRFGLLKQLFDYAEQQRGDIEAVYSVLTNAVLMTPSIADYLQAHVISIGVSLDGIGQVNDFCRFDKLGRGSFDRVLKGLTVLKNAGVTPSIMTTVTSSNFRNLEDLTKFLLDGGYNFRYSMERDLDSGRPKLLEHIPELIETLHRCYDYIEQNLPAEDFTMLHTFGDASFRGPLRRACSAGSSFFAVGHDGSMGICGMGLVQPFSSIEADGDLLDHIRGANPDLAGSRTNNQPPCGDCVWRMSCAGSCPLQTKASNGSFDAASPYCETYRQILPRILRIKGLQMIRKAKLATAA